MAPLGGGHDALGVVLLILMFVFLSTSFTIALLMRLQAAEEKRSFVVVSLLRAGLTTPARWISRACAQSHKRLKSGERLNVQKLMDSSAAAAAKPFSCCWSNLTRQMESFQWIVVFSLSTEESFQKRMSKLGEKTKEGDWTFSHCPRCDSTINRMRTFESSC